MNDDTTPTDEELSAAIDGEADDSVQARIDASADALARQGELRAASARVADVAPLDDETVDQLITAALDAPVAPARPAGRRGPAPWMVAAAVIVLMAVGLTLIWAGRGVESDQASSSATTSQDAGAEASADAADSAAMESSTQSGAGASTQREAESATTIAPNAAYATAGGGYLGSFSSGDELRTATAESFAKAWAAADSTSTGSATGASAPSEAAVTRCADQLKVTLSMKAGPTQSGYARVDGDLVLVYEFATTSSKDATPTTLVAAVGADACQQVVIFER